MRNKLAALVAIGLAVTSTMTACDAFGQKSNAGSDTGSNGGTSTTIASNGKAGIGVILPDTKSAQRWRSDDPKFLKQAFDKAGVPVDMRNAEGDAVKFEKIGDDMINSGVKVLIIVNLDPDSARAVLHKARAKNITTIDYDRLTLNGGADYYVSFDNAGVGKLMATGLVRCLADSRTKNPVVAQLNGSRTDNNATLYKQGFDQVLSSKYDAAVYTQGPDQFVPRWDNDEGGVIFDQMLTQQPHIDAVVAANDGLAGAVIKVLRKKGLNGKIPVTGQDATVEGLQNVLAGDQCLTIYKPIGPEAQTAASLAIQLFKGQKPSFASEERIKDPLSGAYVPFKSIPSTTITADSVKDVVAAGFVDKKDLCTGRFAALCKQHGVI